MKKRAAIIGALVSLMPLGQSLVIRTGAVLTSALAILAVPETAQAETAEFYINRGIAKDDLKDHSGAIADFNRAIEINPRYADAYLNRGIAKKEVGDMKGACADWRKASKLGDQNTAKWVRNQC